MHFYTINTGKQITERLREIWNIFVPTAFNRLATVNRQDL